MGQCGSRERQSPIDFDQFAPWQCQTGLVPPAPCDNGVFNFKYEAVQKEFVLQNDGHSLAVDLAGQGYGGIMFNNKWFNILSVNFHVGSEHTFRGQREPLELHLVHKQWDTEHVLVVAVPFSGPPAVADGSKFTWSDGSSYEAEAEASTLLQKGMIGQKALRRVGRNRQIGSENAALRTLMGSAPLPGRGARSVVPLSAPTDLLTGLVAGAEYFEYRGSLTAPPCLEQATWLVRRAPLDASTEQIRLLHEAIYEANSDYGNYRSVMPLMGRPIFVRAAVNSEPPAVAEYPSTPNASDVRATDFRAIGTAEYALQAAKEAVLSANHLDDGLTAATAALGARTPPRDFLPRGPPAVQTTPPPPTPDPRRLLTRIGKSMADEMYGTLWNAAAAAAASIPTTLPPSNPAPLI